MTDSLSKLASRIAPLAVRPPGTLLIHEIYRSIQGESTHAGLPCAFIRLTACHLRCNYCDTPHAFREGRVMTVDEVASAALSYGDQLVEVTGGEPLLQDEVYPLLHRLADAGRTVLLETGGACDTSKVDPRVRIILDVKTPGSAEAAANHWPNLERLKPVDEVKFVICDESDFDWALGIIEQHRLTERVPVLVSPCFGRVEPAELVNWVLVSRQPLRVQLQLHKLIWGAGRRGV